MTHFIKFCRLIYSSYVLRIKDKSQPVRELTLQEQKELGVTISRNTAADFRRVGGVYASEGQGVKIKIKT